MKKSKKLRRLIKAAKSGKPYAMYRLGICFETGYMTDKNMSNAVKWISSAADAGYIPAKEWISDYVFDDNALMQSES